MKVLVTGAAGFIGRHVVDGLLAHEIVAHKRGDDLPKEVDAVVHCAATSPQKRVSSDQVVRDSVGFTGELLNCVKCKKFIFCSSMSAYGKIYDRDVDQGTPSSHPDVYGASKLLCERMIAASKIPALALRLPGVVGKGAARCWLADVAARIKADKLVTIYNATAIFNNVVHVDDLVEFIAHVLQLEWRRFDVSPIGAGQCFSHLSVKDVVLGLAAAMGYDEIDLQCRRSRKRSFVINSDRLIEAWGYRPCYVGDIINRYAADLQ